MLILKRKLGQAIDVGDDVRIVLKEIRGGQVKIGIEAPREVRITRSEVTRTVRDENLRAARSSTNAEDLLVDLAAITGTMGPGQG
jgi:carbon storage regulator